MLLQDLEQIGRGSPLPPIQQTLAGWHWSGRRGRDEGRGRWGRGDGWRWRRAPYGWRRFIGGFRHRGREFEVRNHIQRWHIGLDTIPGEMEQSQPNNDCV